MKVHPYLTGAAPAPPPVTQTSLPDVPLFARGKVRDIYELGDHLLLVVSDRISAFDVVMNEPIPGKGIVLNTLSAFWFEATAGSDGQPLRLHRPRRLPRRAAALPGILEGRAMLVKRAERIDIECVVRGYLAGSAWSEYRRDGTVAGVTAAGGDAGVGQAGAADLHPRHESRTRGTTSTSPSRR